MFSHVKAVVTEGLKVFGKSHLLAVSWFLHTLHIYLSLEQKFLNRVRTLTTLKYNVNLFCGFTPFIPKSQLLPDEIVYKTKLCYETKTMTGGKAAASLNLLSTEMYNLKLKF